MILLGTKAFIGEKISEYDCPDRHERHVNTGKAAIDILLRPGENENMA